MKLTHLSEKSQLKDAVELVGGYNDAPPGLREITEAEFARSKFFIYNPACTETRQVCRGADGLLERMESLHIFWFYDWTAIAIARDYSAGKVRYFKVVTCEHEMTERTLGRCYTEYTCKKCGFVETIDSSD